MPPTRKEQLQLDELLTDIYKGIETLPDKSAQPANYSTSNATSNKSSSGRPHVLYSRTHVKEYELPASSPIVQQHIANLRSEANNSNYSPISPSKQPTRSTLKRQTPDNSQHYQRNNQQQQPQSLASYLTSSATPESRRRVRIVDHPDKVAKSGGVYSSDDYDDNDNANQLDEPQETRGPKARSNQQTGKVKYVNTNKLIYHQERDPGEDYNSASDSDEQQHHSGGGGGSRNHNHSSAPVASAEDDDIDGVTRVEYYHTTWLDRQLGRASKRRSSKELTERQVKEKAMIEELKRSLKNGAITLKQSFRGNKSNKNKSSADLFDDHAMLNSHSKQSSNNRYKESTVFGSGLATIPRNYSYNNSNNQQQQQQQQQQQTIKPQQVYSQFDSVYRPVEEVEYEEQTKSSIKAPQTKTKQFTSYRETTTLNGSNGIQATPKQTKTSDSYSSSTAPRAYTSNPSTRVIQEQQIVQPTTNTTTTRQQQQEVSSNYSRTLPHNYNQQPKKHHQLLQSHYRGNTLANFKPNPISTSNTTTNNNDNIMRNPNYINNCVNTTNNSTAGPIKSPSQYSHNQQLQLSQQHQGTGETISSIPSATEVVRSALSRSGSQISLNQLNKTINLLPNSPPPYASSPMTPTQNLKAASPSLSPSPFGSRQTCVSPQYTSKTLGSPHGYRQQQQQQPLQQLQPGMVRVTGTRTIERMPAQPVGQQQQQPYQQQQQQQQQQPYQQQQQQQQQQPYQQQQQQSVYANPHASLMQHRQEQQLRQPNRNQASIREFNELDSLLRSLGPGVTTHVTPGFSSKPTQAAFGGYGYNPAAQPQQPQPQQYQQQPQIKTDVYAKVQRNPNEQSKAGYLQQHFGTSNLTQTNAPYTIDVTNKKDDDCIQRQNLSEFEPPIELLPSMEDYQNISKLNPVKNHYWYKPSMSRDRAINLLKDKPQGTFIVRDSTTFKGGFGLAVKVSKLPKNVLDNASLRNPNGDPAAELIRHFLIEQTVNGVRLKGYSNEPVFSSLANLIYQHSLTEIALPCKLVIPRADIEDPRFNQKQKQYYDEFLASKEQAKHNPYDRTSPNGGYRRYPGDVYVHNEHRIIFE